MIVIKTVYKCLLSPRLYKIYGNGPLEAMYEPQGAEKWGDKIITSVNMMLDLTLYASPLISLYVYKTGFLSFEESKPFFNFFGGLSCFLIFAFMLRAYGRATDDRYIQFIQALNGTPNQTQEAYLKVVRKYDFEFAAWPTSFSMPPSTSSWLHAASTWLNPFATKTHAYLPFYKRIPVQLLGYIATHTFALRLIYPGSLGFIYRFLWNPLFYGRSNLVETFNGQRAKIQTGDGNALDTLFVDNRSSSPNGNILVVCCEGNTGFYEIGIMASPIKTGYSALGWNHPGFAESTGLPYPSQEYNAIGAVMHYAIDKLNFKTNEIVLFGWSIGGYTAAWAAVHYPVRGLILDATFDDLLPLARNQMPESWSLLVKEVVRSHVDLNVAEVLQDYSGPVQLVRRTEDEIICLRPGHTESNRGNFLLFEIIKQRHPQVVENKREEVIRYANMLQYKRPLLHSFSTHEDLPLQYVTQYMKDFQSSHCTPLPDELFATLMNNILRNKTKQLTCSTML